MAFTVISLWGRYTFCFWVDIVAMCPIEDDSEGSARRGRDRSSVTDNGGGGSPQSKECQNHDRRPRSISQACPFCSSEGDDRMDTLESLAAAVVLTLFEESTAMVCCATAIPSSVSRTLSSCSGQIAVRPETDTCTPRRITATPSVQTRRRSAPC